MFSLYFQLVLLFSSKIVLLYIFWGKVTLTSLWQFVSIMFSFWTKHQLPLVLWAAVNN